MILSHAAAVATFLTVVLAIAGALVALALLAAAGDFLARNHTMRVRRHQSVPVYYRHLVTGH
ncbi:conserved exported hypothetical protein [Nostocoides australiense Ben110]|uniref:Uncharacterized protein n=2 Tax=Nostocoides australiense TaxID=99480 RepID=W6K2A4_9MICO|nr:hypothetical protein [Actinomycetota bacterium]CCH75672.1 conserved exported hypothetical protein [Tetrasphaera australiensis Ben110]